MTKTDLPSLPSTPAVPAQGPSPSVPSGALFGSVSERLAAAITAGCEHDAIRWHGQDSDGQWCWQYRDAADVAEMIDREIALLRDENERLRDALKWCLGKEPSPCRCMDFATPPHVCVAHRALSSPNAEVTDAKRSVE